VQVDSLPSNSLKSQWHAVIQAHVLHRMSRHVKLGDFKATLTNRVAGIAHITLGVTYLISVLLVLASFMMKLDLVSQHTTVGDSSEDGSKLTCPPGYSDENYIEWPPICLEDKWAHLWPTIDVVDAILRVLFRIMLLLADGLMVSTIASVGQLAKIHNTPFNSCIAALSWSNTHGISWCR
jgi:hypothetical protein